jgi:hypothetical protein
MDQLTALGGLFLVMGNVVVFFRKTAQKGCQVIFTVF